MNYGIFREAMEEINSILHQLDRDPKGGLPRLEKMIAFYTRLAKGVRKRIKIEERKAAKAERDMP